MSALNGLILPLARQHLGNETNTWVTRVNMCASCYIYYLFIEIFAGEPKYILLVSCYNHSTATTNKSLAFSIKTATSSRQQLKPTTHSLSNGALLLICHCIDNEQIRRRPSKSFFILLHPVFRVGSKIESMTMTRTSTKFGSTTSRDGMKMVFCYINLNHYKYVTVQVAILPVPRCPLVRASAAKTYV